MKIGIKDISYYIPPKKISNLNFNKKFKLKNKFIENKIGFLSLSRISKNETTVDLALKSSRKLLNKYKDLKNKIECLVLVSQNPYLSIPHNSSIIHRELGLSEKCIVFDVSLGCSGFVHGISIIKSFMEANNLKNGILITADPYSKIIDNKDKETAMIFGDASSSTLLSNDKPKFLIKNFDYGTKSEYWEALKLNKKKKLEMNGRVIFDFVSKNIPRSIKKIIKKENLLLKDIDLFVLHQGSKFVIDAIAKSLNVENNKIVFSSKNYGNTVSSSIPIILSNCKIKKSRKIICSGFGVGLSWSTMLLESLL